MRGHRGWIVGVVLAALVGVGAGGCGKSGEASIGTIDGEADFHTFMETIVLPLAGVLGQLAATPMALADDPETVFANPTSCPGGGTAAFDGPGAKATFTDCKLSSVGISGTLGLFLQGDPAGYSANLGAGTLTLSGAAMGTVQIVNGMIQWKEPATDAGTFWLARANLGGMMVCTWSGGGVCP